MSAVDQASQFEAQAAQVEEEYHREDKREYKVMDAKLLAPKFNTNLVAKAYGDNLSTWSESSRTLTRPIVHLTLHRHIGNHGLGLGVAVAPRGHQIECRLVDFARSLGDDRFKGAQGLSSRFASEC